MEDRTLDPARRYAARLVPEPVPLACMGLAPRTRISRKAWLDIRQAAILRAGHRCEICGAAGGRGMKRLEAHERYHDQAIYSLGRILCVCGLCHEAMHPYRAIGLGHGKRAVSTLMRVNGRDREWAEWILQVRNMEWQEDARRMVSGRMLAETMPFRGFLSETEIQCLSRPWSA